MSRAHPRDPNRANRGCQMVPCAEDRGGTVLSSNDHIKVRMPSGARLMFPHGKLSPGVKRALVAAILAGVMIIAMVLT